MSMEITGEVKHISEIETFGAKNTQKRFIVIEVVDGDYSNAHGFQVFNDKCGMFDGVEVGQEVTISYNLGTVREWNGKWFADMHRAWKLAATGASVAAPAEDSPAKEEEKKEEAE